MKIELPKSLLASFVKSAKEGEGRETEIGGGNKQVDITVLKADIEGYPELNKLAGGTVRIYLNKQYKFVGHKTFGPQPKKKGVAK